MTYIVGRRVNILDKNSRSVFVKLNAEKDIMDERYLYCEYYYIPVIKDFYRRKELRFEYEIRKVDFTLQNIEEMPKIEYVYGIMNRLAEVYKKHKMSSQEKVMNSINNEEDKYYKISLDKYMYHENLIYSAKVSSLENIADKYLDISGHQLKQDDIGLLIVNAY